MTQLSNAVLEDVLKNSECLITTGQVNAAYDRLVAQLNLHYHGLNPLVVIVMNGGLIPAGQLLTKLNFFHRMEYIHATRYRQNTGTNQLEWRMRPQSDIKDQHVLLIDDIFDEGVTLKTIVDELSANTPKSLKTCVLLNKVHNRKVPDFEVDFIGTNVVDRYIYGCGMDYHGYLRHLPGIYALKER